MIWNATATILRRGAVTKNTIGEKIVEYEPIGSTKIRFFTNSSSYLRTQTGYVKANVYKGIIPYKTDIKQGDKLSINNKEYMVMGVNDDGMGIYLNLDLE